ncbi:two-component system sensor histidine kinase NtrB [Teredinibacter sp. KSP-S5-2]|uniref:two-component system sensor histidine kinase NtrB n=1 Tax=Teredinibacter sp. KSP-S5-2 TaxID=3034506 RepID=UPI00293498DE|nr:ATP-binding protein [Teredinibacter sp. KSP-S5-2]WNO11065.1 ATP-binding protein [Teredinibacter sp. KSP-S5-2]
MRYSKRKTVSTNASSPVFAWLGISLPFFLYPSPSHADPFIREGMAYTLLICALILIVLQAGIIMLLSKRNRELEKKPGSNNPQPQILAKTKQQLYREIARHEATEELLRETQEYMQCIVNSMPYVLVGITPDGYVTHWNNAAEKATGLPAEEALGAHVNQVYPNLPIDVETIESIFSSGLPFHKENVQEGQGSNATFIDITLFPLNAVDIAGAVILAEDVTKRVRVESMMIQNEKMRSLGELAAGLAHEINNPLSGVLNNVQNIFRRTSLELEANKRIADELGIELPKLQAYLEARGIFGFLEKIREAGDRAAQIVTNMLEFSRNNNSTHVATNLLHLVEHSLQLAQNNFELETAEGVEIPRVELNAQKDLPLVVCSSSEIQQVLLNLLSNAAQSFQSNEYGPPLEPVIRINLSTQNNTVILEVSDNGPGIPEPVQKHIFEPFYTTKDVGKGTGLGLSVSYFIITEHHQGTIQVESKAGEGTCFTIKLPISPSPNRLPHIHPTQH